jgi:diaminopimelate decarboxylase
MTTYNQISQIERRFGTPFYIFDEKTFRKNCDCLVRAFTSRYPKFILAYSYKTNYIPYLCKIIKEKGGFAEVVSRLEYDLALKVGQNPGKIIFNGPVKRYDDIELALKNKSTLNLDSETEIEYVKKYASKNPKQQIKIGLRINIGLSDKSGQSRIQGKLPVGRFGFDPAKTSITNVIKSLTKHKNIRINSLHGHTSTTDRSVWCYKIITETLCDIADRYFPDSIEYINIGGGIFGYMPTKMRWIDTPTFDDYAKIISSVLNSSVWVRRKKPTLVLEPGVAMAANTLSLVTKVVSIKRIRQQVFVTTDGSAFYVKPTFHKINQPYKIIKKQPRGKIETYNVVGSTCMEKDYLLTEITDIAAQKGDYIMINNAGAYTVVLTPPFINPAPPILVRQKNGFKVIRKRQTLENIFCNYLFE